MLRTEVVMAGRIVTCLFLNTFKKRNKYHIVDSKFGEHTIKCNRQMRIQYLQNFHLGKSLAQHLTTHMAMGCSDWALVTILSICKLNNNLESCKTPTSHTADSLC